MTVKRALTAGLLLSAILLSACNSHPAGEEKARPIISGVTSEKITAEYLPDQVRAVGSVRPRNAAQLAARIAGTVTAVRIKEGDSVTKGMLLVNIASAETTAGAAGALAAVDQARHGVEEARARKQFADLTFDRYHKLSQEEAVTRQEYDGKVVERDVAARSLARAEAALVAAKEGAKGASSLAGYGRVTTPVSGIVVNKAVEVGMTVFPGTPLLTVEEQGAYRLELAVPETLLGKVKAGDRLPLKLEGVPAPKDGTVEEIVPTVDRASRTFMVKIRLHEKGLRTGVYGEALFKLGSHQGLLLPMGAITSRGALTTVWVVGTDGVVRMRILKTGKQVGDKVEVLSGLAAGEAVVTAGMEKVVEGARVETKHIQK